MMSISEAVGRFLDHLVKSGRATENTIIGYRGSLRIYIMYVKDRGLIWDRIEFEQAAGFIPWLLGRSKSKGSVSRYVCQVRGFYNWAVASDLTDKNRFGLVKCPKVPTNLKEVLTLDEVNRLYESLDATDTMKYLRSLVILDLLYACGLRIAEASGLKWSALRTSPEGKFTAAVIQGKGGKFRLVPMTDEVAYSLSRWKRELELREKNIETILCTISIKASERVMAHTTINYILYELSVRSGLEKPITAHTLRRSIASHLYEKGVPLIDIREFLGHSTLETTIIYVKATPDQVAGRILKVHPRRLPAE